MNMKQLRERKGLRTVDVASRVGIAESTVRNWEYGKTIPKLRIDQFSELMKLYECSFDELMTAVKESANALE
ncbi:transcriptional regulator [Nostoc sp. 'Peltigera membranacea cyanobiont' 213]|jgi:putative transcriptional regulator|uniref:Helix-turn-helix transcriptional regulator n=3 Tax=Nostoc TaxID=1177 RepID=A0ABR8IG84_9NOSO|nr:helix-turn-helix transcriptional regulator [Nostoc sp. 'Peltigera membranacea cyanobiont' 213]MBD2563875.1 helix-turn-helix transcriptional regulator [Nostoc linckia FACHB-391]MBD2649947.1 helix-turn-helix transcriptional regulator [Nostoc foliaceum FACHB-393]MCC5622161.1 helix-turn-helix domain-containing protein [Nostoc sp. CHAB 5715]OYD87767.1 transcriptional regulator [Nostoc sp. 'Peltigera membranacea cyanobiont' 213]